MTCIRGGGLSPDHPFTKGLLGEHGSSPNVCKYEVVLRSSTTEIVRVCRWTRVSIGCVDAPGPEEESCANQLDAYKVLLHKSEITHLHLIMLAL